MTPKRRSSGSRGRVTAALVALLVLVLVGWGVRQCTTTTGGMGGAPPAVHMTHDPS